MWRRQSVTKKLTKNTQENPDLRTLFFLQPLQETNNKFFGLTKLVIVQVPAEAMQKYIYKCKCLIVTH